MAKPKYNTENHNKATNSLWLIADINHMIASLRSFTCIKTTSILSLVLNIFLFLFHYRVIAWLIHNTVTWTIRRLNFYFLINYSAWIQVNSGINIPIRAVFKTSNGFKHAGAGQCSRVASLWMYQALPTSILKYVRTLNFFLCLSLKIKL